MHGQMAKIWDDIYLISFFPCDLFPEFKCVRSGLAAIRSPVFEVGAALGISSYEMNRVCELFARDVAIAVIVDDLVRRHNDRYGARSGVECE